MKKVSEEFKDLSNTKESSKRSIAYNRLRNLNSDEIKTHAEQIAKQVAFSTESLGGAKYKPVFGWCVVKLLYDNSLEPEIEYSDSEEGAIEKLNTHISEELGLNLTFDDIPNEVKKLLVFPAPMAFRVFNGNDDITDLNHEDQVKEIQEKINKKVLDQVKLLNPKDNAITHKWYPDSVTAILEHEHYVQDKIRKMAKQIRDNISDISSFDLKKGAKSVNIPDSAEKWVKYQSEQTASTVDSILEQITPNTSPMVAEVLSVSHPILSHEKIRKPIDSNDHHSVFTTSNPRQALLRMATQGFDNQPIYCKNQSKCVATLKLSNAINHLSEFPNTSDFTRYEELISQGILSRPPPLFSAYDTIDQIIGLFNSGCEAILFEFKSELWDAMGLDNDVTAILNDGLHIMTPHDIAAYYVRED